MTELVKHEPTTIYIKPSKGFTALNLRDLWLYRELVFFMVWRDIKVRYKQTMLGAAWAILQPVLTMIAMFFLFNRVAKLPTDNIPYPIFSYTALLPWGLFVGALNQGSRSLTSNHNMITKVYFPKLILPLASVIGGLVDFAIASVILVALFLYYKVAPAWNLLWVLPLFLLLAILCPAATTRAELPVEFVGQFGGLSNAVAVSGNLAYLGMGNCLVILGKFCWQAGFNLLVMNCARGIQLPKEHFAVLAVVERRRGVSDDLNQNRFLHRLFLLPR